MGLARPRTRNSMQFWGLVVFLALAFLLGGGARPDLGSLIILRPLAVVACCLAAVTLSRRHLGHYRILFGFAAALFLIVGLHLVPLPASIWAGLPGREIIADIDKAAQLGEVWRPLSMAPLATWNSLYALFTPLAALLLAVQINREEQYRLLPVMIALGLASGMIGLLQVAGPHNGPLYFYNITNNGSAVGLFANRNHQAVFLACLFPMLAVYAASGDKHGPQNRARPGLAIAAALVLVPLILVTGSRAGLAIGALGLFTIPVLYRRPRSEVKLERHRKAVIAALVAGFCAIIVLAIAFGRAESFSRLVSPDALDDSRFTVWGPIAESARNHFPFGSGLGTFAEIHKIHEPDQLLRTTYFNHAHNDWLELYLTGGLLTALLLFMAVGTWAWASYHIWRKSGGDGRRVVHGKLASILLLMLGIASFFDYPLRVPSLSCVVVICAVWLRTALSTEGNAPATMSAEFNGNVGDSRLAQPSGF